MKILKYSSILIGLLLITVFGYRYLTTVEVTKVTLKCKVFEGVDSIKKGELTYYKVTKHLFSDEPVKLLNSYPDDVKNNYPPLITGYEENSPTVKDIKFEKKYFHPDYYIFIDQPDDKVHLFHVNYLNREDLIMEDYVLEDQKFLGSKKQCEVISEKDFDKDWESKVTLKKSKLKI